ncbi:MAG TPA: hypothetical protein VEA99_06055 [Gemmatimonadaceae bacterium]|nr:hypothetical protein [Gemmatimonadaceae bacterium]
MGHRHQQHQGRSAGDDRELPGRDVQADDAEALDGRATRSGPVAGKESGEKPTKGRGGAQDAE